MKKLEFDFKEILDEIVSSREHAMAYNVHKYVQKKTDEWFEINIKPIIEIVNKND